MSTVNIILSTYNGEKYLAEQIDSIIGSTFTDWSLHIFDDCSLDGTTAIAEHYCSIYPERISLHRGRENRGGTLNFLNGLQTVTKEYVEPSYYMFCDQDDIWNEDKIERTLRRMHQMERKYGKRQPLMVFTDAFIMKDGKINGQTFYRESGLNTGKLGFGGMLMENKCIGCTVMINSLLAGMVQIIPRYARYHDWWLALIASGAGHISFLPLATMKYRQHGNNVVGSLSFAGYVQNRISRIGEQKSAIRANYSQAREFFILYEDMLADAARKKIACFIRLQNMSWLGRRYMMFRYGFFKSGFIRNVGLFLLI